MKLFEVGNEARNPPRRGLFPIKRCGVPCAHVAKKPNHKSGCVNRPADAFGTCHPTQPRFSAAVATSISFAAQLRQSLIFGRRYRWPTSCRLRQVCRPSWPRCIDPSTKSSKRLTESVQPIGRFVKIDCDFLKGGSYVTEVRLHRLGSRLCPCSLPVCPGPNDGRRCENQL
jgi:hypothetical protein